MFLLIPILLPVLAGVLVLALPVLHRRTPLRLVSGCVFVAELAAVLIADSSGVILTPALSLGDNLALMLSTDGMGKLFTLLVACIFAVVGFYAFSYLTHEEREWQFIGFYLLTEGALMLVGFAGSLVTFYMGYEMMTLFSLPLVLHERTPEAVAAAKKYLYYSSFGALCGLFGIFVLTPALTSAGFTAGGSLGGEVNGMTLAAVFVMLLGFGVKSALFPFQNWLPAASIAPTPVTALLHAVAVVNAGAFAIIRVTYYNFGTEMLRGSWAQWVPMALCVITIVYGSTMSVKEPHFKRRLAFSTVSNLSYILLGASLMSTAGLTGGLTHMVFHGIIKITAFFCAGAVMTVAKRNYLSEMAGIGRRMPVTFAAFTIASCALVGIPPFNGFISKWKLVSAAVTDGSVMGVIGGIAIFVSAMLTVVYMFSVVIKAFFPQKGETLCDSGKDPGWMELLPMVVFSLLMLLTGLFPQLLTGGLASVAAGLC